MGSRLSSSGGGGGAGTVTSVGLTTSGVLHTVSGTPVVGAGTLSLDLKTQVQNTLLAGPASGVDATPTMRALLNADIPSGITGSKIAGALSGATLATSALTGTITASQLAVSAPTSGQLSGLTTSNLSATAGLLGSQLDAAAAIASGQITSLAAAKLTGTNTLPDSVLSTNVPLLAASNVFTTGGSSASSGTVILHQIAPTVSQSSTAAYTALDVNVTESSTGSGAKLLLNLRVGSTSKLKCDNGGNLTATGSYIAGNTSVVSSGLNMNTGATTIQATTNSTSAAAFTLGFSSTNGLTASSGAQAFLSVAPNVNQTSTAGYTALKVYATETAVGSGTKLLADFGVGSTSKASIDDTGALAFSPATTTSAPSAGAAGALPATPLGYATVTINGTARQVAYY